MSALDNLPEYFSDLIDQLADAQVWPWVVGGAAALAIVVIATAVLRSRRRRPPPLPEMVVVDLASVGDLGPPEDGPELRCYGLGVRLAVLILAPSGRQREVPTSIERSAMIDQIVPGLAKVVAVHRTLVVTAATTLRQHGLRIWHAAVDAVRSDHLVRQALLLDGGWLLVDDEPIELAKVRRLVVVGAGKAGAGMAAAVEEILERTGKDFSGWVNVPADCVRPLRHITLHPARPAGVNEPTAEGVAGSEQILRLVESLTAED